MICVHISDVLGPNFGHGPVIPKLVDNFLGQMIQYEEPSSQSVGMVWVQFEMVWVQFWTPPIIPKLVDNFLGQMIQYEEPSSQSVGMVWVQFWTPPIIPKLVDVSLGQMIQSGEHHLNHLDAFGRGLITLGPNFTFRPVDG